MPYLLHCLRVAIKSTLNLITLIYLALSHSLALLTFSMQSMTITEGLSEINLVKKKLIAKYSQLQTMVLQAEHLPDPFLSSGGSKKVFQNETQAIQDLNQRLMKLRNAISRANLENSIHIMNDDIKMTLSIHDWLIWKREIYKPLVESITQVNKIIKNHMDVNSQRPQVYKDEMGNVQLIKTGFNMDYAENLKHQQSIIDLFEKLDGQLSLKNATILISI